MAMESDLQQTISLPGEANTSPLTHPGVISVVHNEQYRLEQELEERVRQLEGIFEAMTDGLIVYDREGRVLQTNTAAERLLAMNNQSISYYQRSVRERAPFYTVRDEHGQLLTAEQGPVMRVLKGEKLTSENAMDIQVSTPDGREIQLSVNCSPLHDQTGQFVGAVCIYHDVTERRANELALRVANQRMDEFLSMVSHELRTPLTTIKASIQLARRRVASSLQEIVSENDTQYNKLVEMQAILDRAERQVNIQNRLIDDLLEVSRIQAHKLTLHLKECDLATIVREAVEDQQATMPHHPIQMELSVTEPVMLSVDADRIQQVLTNYLTNACKYSPADHPIVVRLQVKGEYICVCVHDEGPGLPPEEQAQVWERFYRVQGIEAKNGSTVGLGLGLPICRAIIEQHQGQVGVESTPGIGSTFWFALPLTGK